MSTTLEVILSLVLSQLNGFLFTTAIYNKKHNLYLQEYETNDSALKSQMNVTSVTNAVRITQNQLPKRYQQNFDFWQYNMSQENTRVFICSKLIHAF